MGCETDVTSHPKLSGAWRVGLRGIKGVDRARLTLSDPLCCGGSADIDAHRAPHEPQAPRWDYVLDYAGCCHFIEVHPATTGEVGPVLAKFEWLKALLAEQTRTHACPGCQFHWVASGRVAITPNSQQQRRLARSGLGQPKSHLVLR